MVLRANERLASGQGVATDILEASARAYVRALSNALEGAAIREAEEATADAAVERTPGPVGPPAEPTARPMAVPDAPQADSPFWWIWERRHQRCTPPSTSSARGRIGGRPPGRAGRAGRVGRPQERQAPHPPADLHRGRREPRDRRLQGRRRQAPGLVPNLMANPETTANWYGDERRRPGPRGRGRRARAPLGADGRGLPDLRGLPAPHRAPDPGDRARAGAVRPSDGRARRQGRRDHRRLLGHRRGDRASCSRSEGAKVALVARRARPPRRARRADRERRGRGARRSRSTSPTTARSRRCVGRGRRASSAGSTS